MRGAYLTQLMARPVATLHSAVWAVQGGEDSRDLVPFLAPCMFGRPVEIASAGGVTCWVRLEPSEREMDDHGGAVLELRVEPCAQEELAADSTVRMEVGVGGAITLTAGGQAFGWGESVPSLLEEALVVAEGASAELLEEWQRRVSDEVEFCVPCMARCADNTAVAAVLRVRDGSLETEGGSRRGEGHSVGSRKGRRGSRPGNKMRLSLDLVRLDTVRVIAHVGRLGEVLKVSTQVETLSDLLGGLGEKIKAMLPGGEEMLKKLMRSVAAQNRCTPRVGGAELELQDGVRARCTVQAALPQDAQEAYVFVWMSPGEEQTGL